MSLCILHVLSILHPTLRPVPFWVCSRAGALVMAVSILELVLLPLEGARWWPLMLAVSSLELVLPPSPLPECVPPRPCWQWLPLPWSEAGLRSELVLFPPRAHSHCLWQPLPQQGVVLKLEDLEWDLHMGWVGLGAHGCNPGKLARASGSFQSSATHCD